MYSNLYFALIKVHQEELARRAERHRFTRPEPTPSPSAHASAEITIRPARPEDRRALNGLVSAVDRQDAVLVADVDGKVVGAYSLDGTSRFGRAADPLIGDLLALRAAQLRPVRRRASRLRKAASGGC